MHIWFEPEQSCALKDNVMHMSNWTHTILLPRRGAARRSLFVLAWEIVCLWQRRSEERYRLHELDERMLKDIGVSRADVSREARKPFWQG